MQPDESPERTSPTSSGTQLETSNMTLPPRQWIDLDVLARAMGLKAEQVRRRSSDGKLPRPSFHLGYTRPLWDRTLLVEMLPQRARDRLVEAERAAKKAAAARSPRPL